MPQKLRSPGWQAPHRDQPDTGSNSTATVMSRCQNLQDEAGGVINRSSTRGIPDFSVALYEVVIVYGTLVAETILASVHVRAHQQAEHMDASDLIKALQITLQGGGRPHMENTAELQPTS